MFCHSYCISEHEDILKGHGFKQQLQMSLLLMKMRDKTFRM